MQQKHFLGMEKIETNWIRKEISWEKSQFFPFKWIRKLFVISRIGKNKKILLYCWMRKIIFCDFL